MTCEDAPEDAFVTSLQILRSRSPFVVHEDEACSARIDVEVANPITIFRNAADIGTPSAGPLLSGWRDPPTLMGASSPASFGNQRGSKLVTPDTRRRRVSVRLVLQPEICDHLGLVGWPWVAGLAWRGVASLDMGKPPVIVAGCVDSRRSSGGCVPQRRP